MALYASGFAKVTEHFSECLIATSFQYVHKLIKVIEASSTTKELLHEVIHKGTSITHIVFAISYSTRSIIIFSFLFVGQNLVRSRYFLKFLCGSFALVLRMFVWMPFLKIGMNLKLTAIKICFLVLTKASFLYAVLI